MKDRVVIERAWLEKFKDMCNEEQLKEISYGLLQYGLYENSLDSSDPVVNVALNFIEPQIDNMQTAYEKKVNGGKVNGRPAKIDKKKVWELARQGTSAADIAQELGVESVKSIYSNEGWKKRKEDIFII